MAREVVLWLASEASDRAGDVHDERGLVAAALRTWLEVARKDPEVGVAAEDEVDRVIGEPVGFTVQTPEIVERRRI